MEYLLLFPIIIWLIGVALLPITIWTRRVPDGYNAVNYPGLILIRPGLSLPGAVWAQEFYEARWRWITLPLTALPHFIGRIVPRLAYFERALELMGHEVEVWAEATLTHAPPGTLRRREAQALAAYKAFRGWGVAKIEDAMAERANEAIKFAHRHRRRIEKMHGKGKSR